jgi:hypothetical protein
VSCGSDGAFQAVGINGRAIYVNQQTRVVIAQFGAWPQASAPPEIRGEGAQFSNAIVAALGSYRRSRLARRLFWPGLRLSTVELSGNNRGSSTATDRRCAGT